MAQRLEQNDRVEPAPRYQEEPASPQGGGWKPIVIPAAIAVLLVYLIAIAGYLPGGVTISQYNSDQKALVEKVQAVTNQEITDISAVSKNVDSAKTTAADASTKANQASASIASIQGDVNALKSANNNFASQSTAKDLQGKIDGLTTTLTNLQNQLTAVNSNITALQGGTSGTPLPTTSKVTATFSTSNWVSTSYTPQANALTFQLPFKLTVTNNLARDITNLQLFVAMYSQGNTQSATSATMQSLTGGTWTMLYATGSPAQTYAFTNTSGYSTWGGSGLSLAAHSSVTITLIFNYTANVGDVGHSIYFSPDIAPIATNDYTVS